MSYQINEIIDFVRAETGYKREITDTTTLDKDLKVYGDDHHELMEKYSKNFNVDMSQYLWYFHTGEEGFSFPGGLFFKPPYARVKRMDITIGMLLEASNTGKWSYKYPEHSLPKHRYDMILNAIIFIPIALWGVWLALNKYLLH